MKPQEAWNAAFNQLEIQLDRASFETWLRDVTFLRYEQGIFFIGVPNSYTRDMLQHRLNRNIRRVLSDVFGQGVDLEFEICKPLLPPDEDDLDEDMPLFRLLAEQTTVAPIGPLHEQVARPQRPSLPESELNPRLTFERFIVNNASRMTYEAALAVSERPARVYNPFMLYGGVGLGKTHLLQAIGHVCQSRGLRVIYIPSEVFTNDLVSAIRQRTTAMFREKYRSLDILLVDDVQFIAGKESTQEEFFHTFNTLYTFNKQIVLASDRHPRELVMLEERLRSRFEGGLVMDVQPPELETRIAILEMWAQERAVELSRPICEMIASRANANVRELEGIFNQVVATRQISQREITLDTAETLIEHYERPRCYVSLAQVLDITARHHGIDVTDLTGPRRNQRVNHVRQIAMYLAREYTEASLVQIGQVFGRSHTTVLHGCNKIADELEINDELFFDVEAIREQLLDDVR